MSSNDLRRQQTGEIELGISEALERHATRHVVPPKPVSQRRLDFEHRRPRIMRECMAEATGVFFYVFPGIAAVASFTLAITSSAGEELGVPVFGSIFNIGFAFALGIAFAIITCAPVSGGHFNPAITICLAIWQGFPWKKVPHYIFSQVFGAFLAGLFLMGCYWPEIQAAKAADLKNFGTVHYNGGVASILCTYPNPGQTNQGYIFFQEFFVDSFIGIIIWTCLDPANPFVSPVSVPFTIGLAYAVMVWGFAANSISTNLARDLGTRIVAAIFFGKEAFTLDNGYSWISILVNVPATIFATGYYEFLMRDSIAKILKGHGEHEEGQEGLTRHVSRVTQDPMVRGAMQSTITEKDYAYANGNGANGRQNGSANGGYGAATGNDIEQGFANATRGTEGGNRVA